jgi:hypothetical protein
MLKIERVRNFQEQYYEHTQKKLMYCIDKKANFVKFTLSVILTLSLLHCSIGNSCFVLLGIDK